MSEVPNAAKGTVILVGQFCEGILMTRGKIMVERWELGKTSQLRRSHRVGSASLSCERVCEGLIEDVEIDDDVDCESHLLTVVEIVRTNSETLSLIFDVLEFRL